MIKLFDLCEGITKEKYHDKFLNLINKELMMDNERNILSSWTEGFVDRDGKIVREFQTTFHSSFWEFYLYAYFKKCGFKLDQSRSRPDFLIDGPKKICIEAVVSNIKQNGVPENKRTIADQISMMIPPWMQADFSKLLDEAIVRHSNAINSKRNKYIDEYHSLPWVDSLPFVIATASYDQINYGREYIYPMMALLFGLYYIPEKRCYVSRASIKKPGTNSDISINLFAKPEFEKVSAILYSCTNTIGKLTSLAISSGRPSMNKVYALRENLSGNGPQFQLQEVGEDNPEWHSDGLFVFHNPNAKYPLDQSDFPNCTHFFFEDNNIKISNFFTPLVARINTSIIFERPIRMMIEEYLRIYNGVSFEEFYDITYE